MNRRQFLKSIGIMATAVTLAPEFLAPLKPVFDPAPAFIIKYIGDPSGIVVYDEIPEFVFEGEEVDCKIMAEHINNAKWISFSIG